MVLKLRNKISIPAKKLIVIILLEALVLMCLIGVYKDTYASELISRNYSNIPFIQEKIIVKSTARILNKMERVDFDTSFSASNSNFFNIKNTKIKFIKNGYIVSGNIRVKDIVNFSNLDDVIDVEYVFNKNGDFKYGKIELGNLLNEDIKKIIKDNILNSNENLSHDDIKNLITYNSNVDVIFSFSTDNIVNEQFNYKLMEQISNIHINSDSIDNKLLEFSVNNNKYVINKSVIDEANKDDSAIKKDDVILYLKDKVVYGVSGNIENIDFNNVKSEKDLIKSLGKPNNIIKNTYYWELKNNDKTLYVIYFDKNIEVMYK